MNYISVKQKKIRPEELKSGYELSALIEKCKEEAIVIANKLKEDIPNVQIRVCGIDLSICKDFGAREHVGNTFLFRLTPYGSTFYTDADGNKHTKYNQIMYEFDKTISVISEVKSGAYMIEHKVVTMRYTSMEDLAKDDFFVERITDISSRPNLDFGLQ